MYLRCERLDDCETAVGLLVTPADPDPERCTATLVGPDEVLTAAHCVAAPLREAGESCRGSWLAFPALDAAASGPEWIECAQVLEITRAPDDSALHQEFARLQLASPARRQPLQVDGGALDPGSIVRVVSVTPHPVYARSLTQHSRLCRSVGAEPAVAALGEGAAGVGWLQDCTILPGNSGSPVLDRAGHVRAIVHGGTARSFALGVTSRLGPSP